MSNFIENLVHRHTQPGENIRPLIRAPFEPGVISQENLSAYPHPDPGFDMEKGVQNSFGSKSGRQQMNFNQEKQNTNDTLDTPGYEKREIPQANPGTFFKPVPGEYNVKDQPHSFFDPMIGQQPILPAAARQIKNVDFKDQEQINTKAPEAGTENELNPKRQQGNINHLPETGKISFLNTGPDLSGNIGPVIKEPVLNRDPFGLTEAKTKQYQGDLSDIGELRKAYRDLENRVLKAEASQVIKVTIGRIDIRAVSKQAPAVLQTKTPPASPKMSLDEYLKKRNNND